MAKGLTVLVLAAGRGTRMRSAVAKVLHPVLGRPLLAWVLDVARGLPATRRGVIVGFQAEAVARAVPPGFEIVHQERLWGTGHAVRQARRLFAGAGDTLVLSGDTPLLAAGTVRRLLAHHRRRRAAVSFLTARLAEPAGYGRVLRCGEGRVKAIVEHDDAPPEVREIREVNAGVYCFENRFLGQALGRLRAANRQDEYYLTDVVAAAVRAGLAVAGVPCDDPEAMLGVNDRAQLAQVSDVLRRRVLARLMRAGVTVVDPDSTWVEPSVRVGADSVLFPGTTLQGTTVVAAGCHVGPFARLRDSRLGTGSVIRDCCVIEASAIGPRCQVGPFAHLRPGTRLDAGVRLGNFVETKKAHLREGAKASHLSYLGDAEIGRRTNVGAGTITCNYDGFSKFRTTIGDDVFVGSDTQLIAPVRVGRRSAQPASTFCGVRETTSAPAGTSFVTVVPAATSAP
ncbi:MAG TPA: bifunctional UDP-N-acetylglucosamine diphosphorylase/glucosamine-1-phosphate N-acetyltransferase GlmU, partial [Candidatus Methanoperedens sp.]|nr:bifunctional UDP-N-acetylglucosamine diphosphorylase/glucosamine-1-phosphate N-acetyltransferase GlmU [Candidatus Methanoperedens sp.]